ncbi:MAG: regulatory protein RecX [Flavobacteriaceae bacterium]
MKTYSVHEALEKLRHYCAYQERCHKEVKDKLYSMQMIPDAVEQITGTLVAENYLNESRFAQQFAHGKFSIKHWGKLRITRELKARAISDYDIRKALLTIDEESYLEKISSISSKKWQQLAGNSLQVRKQKLYQYLAYRGWETHLIYAEIDALSTND